MDQLLQGLKEKEYKSSLKLLQTLSLDVIQELNLAIENIDEKLAVYQMVENALHITYKDTFLEVLNLKEFCMSQLTNQYIDQQLIIDLVTSLNELLSRMNIEVKVVHERWSVLENVSQNVRSEVEINLQKLQLLLEEIRV